MPSIVLKRVRTFLRYRQEVQAGTYIQQITMVNASGWQVYDTYHRGVS
jgi:hypothetical protein